jgi:hypothetical protein
MLTHELLDVVSVYDFDWLSSGYKQVKIVGLA